MTDEGARRWRVERQAELAALIRRAPDLDALAAIERRCAAELTPDLVRALQQRMTALKAGGAR